jgi:hypothetical protein
MNVSTSRADGLRDRRKNRLAVDQHLEIVARPGRWLDRRPDGVAARPDAFRVTELSHAPPMPRHDPGFEHISQSAIAKPKQPSQHRAHHFTAPRPSRELSRLPERASMMT